MTRSYYNQDLTAMSARVVSAETKGSLIRAVFDDTIFYPGGGGQPCDLGRVSGEQFDGEVVRVFEQDGKIVHEVRADGELRAGERVELVLDVKRRGALMRMHTGEHILFKSLQNALADLRLVKIDLGTEESKLFVEGADVSWDAVFRAEAAANAVIRENRTITEKEYARDEALKIEGLRVKPERIAGNVIRVIRIENFDLSACRGIHAGSTGTVGSVLVTGIGKSGRTTELRFIAGAHETLLAYSRALRDAATHLKTSPQDVPKLVQSLQEELAALKARYRTLAAQQGSRAQEERVGAHDVVWNVTHGVERKQLMDAATKLCTDGKIVFFADETEGKCSVMLLCAPQSGVKANELLARVLNACGGRGGGRERVAMGSCSATPDAVVAKLKEELAKA